MSRPTLVDLFPSLRLYLLVASAFCACRCAPSSPTPARGAPPDDGTRSVVTATGSGVSLDCPDLLAATRSLGSQAGSYRVPTEGERAAARSAFQALVQGSPVDPRSFGFETVSIPSWPGVVLLREQGDKKRGGGAYVVRTGSTSSFVVQAPHTFYDEGTFPLACDLFQRSRARALFINTTHRYKSSPATADGEHPADVAHAADSFFLAMTEGLLAALPSADVIQLHGFQNREASARAVVSSGDRKPGSPLVARVRSAFETAVGPRVLAYPEDTNELGATTNVEGLAVRRSGGRFVHIEMDRELRRSLVDDEAFRGRAFDAIIAGFR